MGKHCKWRVIERKKEGNRKKLIKRGGQIDPFGRKIYRFGDRMFKTSEVYVMWKPAGIATTRGKETCFLDIVADDGKEMNAGIEDFPHFLRAFEAMRTEGGWELSNRADAREFLVGTFSRDEEWGLLNRLDTDTSGMLYFARSREIYEQWRERQRAGKVKKWYLAQVEGKIAWKPREMKEVEGSERSEEIVGAQFFVSGWGDESGMIRLSFPMMHHVQDPERMVSCVNDAGLERMKRRGRGKVLEAESWVQVLGYDAVTDTSIVRVMIHHGWRHQIRVHLATWGHPIVGDRVYGTGREGSGKDAYNASVLQLVSVGCEVEEK